MTVLYGLLILQGCLGAFDTLYHHEFRVALPWRKGAAKELRIHAWRNGLYVIFFLSLAWLAWHGSLAWLFFLLLAAELGLTLYDFVLEDQTRPLPVSERLTHTLLTLNYGAILALLVPLLLDWSKQPSGLAGLAVGWPAWVLSGFAAGVGFWAVRDCLAARRLESWSRVPEQFKADWGPGQTTALISGGSGFIGRAVCHSLVTAGHQVVVLSRRPEAAKQSLPSGIRVVENLAQIPQQLKTDLVINLAGASIAERRWSEERKQQLLASRLRTTERLLHWAEQRGVRPAVWINASAIGFYGDQGNAECSEDSDGDDSFSHALCSAWEALARRAEQQAERVYRLRLGIVLGRYGGPLPKMALPFEFGAGGRIGSGQQWMSWIHLEDVVQIMAQLTGGSRPSSAINAVAPEAVRNAEFSRTLAQILRRPAILPLPAALVRLVFGQMGRELFLFSTRVVPEQLNQAGYRFRYPTLKSALINLVRPK